ncbi:glycosyltransferase family 4 protein [Steroidobacter sp. S1-65]|uniref:Glycosyltransferase family 4 protein n=1 Tax=Steroidobacter gossypii TaxID=2805490 RepID=A0ABS1WZ70_9GAMM|nr:glycosyltransferase family 4 protein [Steroidobacter gossypii]MBM0106227.1 glycosyltransferase family 4 protein [Steroidobacter gossypii]
MSTDAPPVRGTQAASRSKPAVARKRRVLIVASTLHVGGAERVMACLAKNIDRRRFDVSVCYLKENGVVGEEMQREGVELLPLPGREYGKLDRLTFIKLRRLIQQRDFHLIHTHDMHGFMDGSACRLLTPRVRHIHTFHFGNYPHREPHFKRVERLFWRVPDALVAVGHAQAHSIRTLYDIPERRMRVLWNGVDAPVPRVSPVVQAAVDGCSDPIIGSISTLIPQKGLHHLLEAAVKLRNRGARFRLLIVGGGPLQTQLQEQAAQLGLDPQQVRFLGWIPEASDCALPACDIFVQSSLWEAMSVVVLEAMAHGRPMVITRVGENPHVIEDGKTGLLVPSADSDALADALYRLLQDPEWARRLGAAARVRHAERFQVRNMVEDYQALYDEILGNPPTGTH